MPEERALVRHAYELSKRAGGGELCLVPVLTRNAKALNGDASCICELVGCYELHLDSVPGVHFSAAPSRPPSGVEYEAAMRELSLRTARSKRRDDGRCSLLIAVLSVSDRPCDAHSTCWRTIRLPYPKCQNARDRVAKSPQSQTVLVDK